MKVLPLPCKWLDLHVVCMTTARNNSGPVSSRNKNAVLNKHFPVYTLTSKIKCLYGATVVVSKMAIHCKTFGDLYVANSGKAT